VNVVENKKVLELLEKMYIEFNSRFEQIDSRFEQIDSRFEQIDSRFEQIDSRFEQIDSRFEKLEQSQTEIKQEVRENRDAILKIEGIIHDKVGILFDADIRTQERIDSLDKKFSSQLERLEAKIDVLQMETAHIRKIK
jgi:chaperonin cofactor prefoldin